LLLAPVETEVDQKLLQRKCVVIQVARRVSVVLPLMAVLLTQRYSVLERIFCFGKFLVGCGSSAFWQRPAVLLHGRFWHRLDILIFCQSKIIVPNWNKRQKRRGWSCGSQKSHSNQGKIMLSVRT